MEDYHFHLLWLLLISYILFLFLLKLVVHLWWAPRRVENFFMKQGIKGPKYQLFLGNLKELASLNLRASAQSMPPLSHNILPRVLSFYHHWKKIYGIFPFLIISCLDLSFWGWVRVVIYHFKSCKLVSFIYTYTYSFSKTHTHIHCWLLTQESWCELWGWFSVFCRVYTIHCLGNNVIWSATFFSFWFGLCFFLFW